MGSTFYGLVDELIPEVVGGDVYLIFKMKDGSGKPLSDKYLLFTERGP